MASKAVPKVLGSKNWYPVVLTVVATAANNVGKALQKKGTRELPRVSLHSKVLRAYLSSFVWMTGVAVDLVGGVLMLFAISQAPVSVVQPVSACGVALMAVFSHLYLKEVMHLQDWIGVLLSGVGTVGVGLAESKSSIEDFSLCKLICFISGCFVILELMRRYLRVNNERMRKRSGESGMQSLNMQGLGETRMELYAGIQAGSYFGMSTATSRAGFLLAQKNAQVIYAVLGSILSACMTIGGVVWQTQGFRQGRMMVVSTAASVTAIAVGVLVGIIALGEAFPDDQWMLMAQCLGCNNAVTLLERREDLIVLCCQGVHTSRRIVICSSKL